MLLLFGGIGKSNLKGSKFSTVYLTVDYTEAFRVSPPIIDPKETIAPHLTKKRSPLLKKSAFQKTKNSCRIHRSDEVVPRNLIGKSDSEDFHP